MGVYIGSSNQSARIKQCYVGVNGVSRKIKKIYVGDSSGKSQLVFTEPVEEFDLRITFGEGMNDDYNVYCTIDGQTYNTYGYGGFTFVASSDFGRLIPKGTIIYIDSNGSDFNSYKVTGIPDSNVQWSDDVGYSGGYAITIDDTYNISFGLQFFDMGFNLNSPDYLTMTVDKVTYYDYPDINDTFSYTFSGFGWIQSDYSYSVVNGATITLDTNGGSNLADYYYIGASPTNAISSITYNGTKATFQVFGQCEIIAAYESSDMPYEPEEPDTPDYTSLYDVDIINNSSYPLTVTYWVASSSGAYGYQNTFTIASGKSITTLPMAYGDLGTSLKIEASSPIIATGYASVGTPSYSNSNKTITCYPTSQYSSTITIGNRATTHTTTINNRDGWDDIQVHYWNKGSYLSTYANQGATISLECDPGTELMMTCYNQPWSYHSVSGATFTSSGSSSTGYHYSTTINSATSIVIKAGKLVQITNNSANDHSMSYVNGLGSTINTYINSGETTSGLFMEYASYIDMTWDVAKPTVRTTGSVTNTYIGSSSGQFYVGGTGTIVLS